MRERAAHGASVVLACSALKAAYRETLLAGLPDARVVFLRGSREVIAARLAARRGHYMNPALLESQFAVLEPPQAAIVVDVGGTPQAIVAAIGQALERR